jgi:hypothetical protein
MSTSRASAVRILLAVASGGLAGGMLLRSLNASATALHPVDFHGQVTGMFAVLIAVVTAYGIVRYGFKDSLVRITILMLAAAVLAAMLHWVPAARLASLVAIAGILLVSVFSRGGIRRLLALASTLIAAVVGFGFVALASSLLTKCDPKHRWLCDLTGSGLMACLVIVVCVAYSRSRATFLSGPRTGTLRQAGL